MCLTHARVSRGVATCKRKAAIWYVFHWLETLVAFCDGNHQTYPAMIRISLASYYAKYTHIESQPHNMFEHWAVDNPFHFNWWERLLTAAKLYVVSNDDDVIKWKNFPRYWLLVRGIHRSPVNSPQKGQRRGALMFCLICAWINGWVNNGEAGDLRRHAHHDVILMRFPLLFRPSRSWGSAMRLGREHGALLGTLLVLTVLFIYGIGPYRAGPVHVCLIITLRPG